MKGLDRYLTTNPFDEVRGLNTTVIKPWSPKPKCNGKSKKPTITTAGLTNASIRVLNMTGWEVWRNNNIPTFDAKRNCYRSNTTKKGIPDIIGFHKTTGRFIAVEVKNGKDKLSPEQERFLESLKTANGVARIVRNMEDVEGLGKIS